MPGSRDARRTQTCKGQTIQTQVAGRKETVMEAGKQRHNGQQPTLLEMPPEIVSQVLLRLPWATLQLCTDAIVPFRGLLTDAQTWRLRYDPRDQHDPTLTMPPEPVGAYETLYSRWGPEMPGFSKTGFERVCAAALVPAIRWFDQHMLELVRKEHGTGCAVCKNGHRDDAIARHIDAAMCTWCIEAAHAIVATRADTDALDYMLSAHADLFNTYALGNLMNGAALYDRVGAVALLHHYVAKITGDPHGVCTQWCPGTRAFHKRAFGVLDYLHQSECPGAFAHNNWTFNEVFTKCDRPMMEWTAQTFVPRADRFIMQSETLKAAIRNGHADLLLAMVRKGALDISVCLLSLAARFGGAGSITILQHTLDQISVPATLANTDRTSTDRARKRKREQEDQAIVDNHILGGVWRDSPIASNAATFGRLDVIQWIADHRPSMIDIVVARTAAFNLYTPIVMFLHERGIVPFSRARPLRALSDRIAEDFAVGRTASTGRHIKHHIPAAVAMTRSLARAGAPLDASLYRMVLRHRITPLLEVLDKEYGPHGNAQVTADQTMRWAVAAGHLDMIRWVRDNVHGARLCVAIDAMCRHRFGTRRIAQIGGKCACLTCAPNGPPTQKKKKARLRAPKDPVIPPHSVVEEANDH